MSTRATVSVAALLSLAILACSDSTAPRSPAAIVRVSQSITDPRVATTYDVVVRVTTADGAPVAGVAVSWTAESGSTANPLTVSTSQSGEARTSWTLGENVGIQGITATVAGVQPLRYTARAGAAPPATIASFDTYGRSATVSRAVTPRPEVLVRDVYGNPVEGAQVHFSVTEGGGVVDGAVRSTNILGRASVGSWTLGPDIGSNTLVASVAGLQPVVFTATGRSFSITVASVHLNQGSQPLEGGVVGVSGRPGMLRVFLQADGENDSSPMVLLRLLAGSTLLREELLARTGVGVPLAPSAASLSDSWNLVLAAGDIVPGMRAEIFFDEDAVIPDPSTARTYTALLNTVVVPPLRVVLIPVHSTAAGVTGNISVANMHSFMAAARKWMPLSDVLATINPVFTTGWDLTNREAWSSLLGDLATVRVIEGARDEYYHGIVPTVPSIALGGLAQLTTTPSQSGRTALSYDAVDLSGTSSTFAHELGHNLGRRHAPCGDPPNVDNEFPHPNARLGAPSYDIVSGVLHTAANLRDFMSYCSPRGTSDYTYSGILDWRQQDPLARPISGDVLLAQSARETGLLLWGAVTSERVTLNPAFALVAHRVLPDAPGPHSLVGYAADGSQVFGMSFTGTATADAEGTPAETFSFFVPLEDADMQRLSRIELTASDGRKSVQFSMLSGAVLSAAQHTAVVESRAADTLHVQWDSNLFPMALIRDASTGRVLSFARGGVANVRASDRLTGRVEVVLSTGVRSALSGVR